MKKLALLFLVTVALAQSSPQRNSYPSHVQGDIISIPNTAGSQAVSFEYVFTVTPASVSVAIAGCMRGSNGSPGNIGTCDAAVDTYTGTSNSIRSPTFTKVYDTFTITVTTLSAGSSLTVNTTVVVSKVGTSTGSGSGTVTNTGGSLTANAVVLGAGTNDTKVSTGITTNGASELDLGVSGTSGVLGLNGSTSGKATCTAPAVAGTATNGVSCSNIWTSSTDGTVTNPAYGFSDSGRSGIYEPAAGTLGLVGTSINISGGVSSTLFWQMNGVAGNFIFTGTKGQHINTQAANNDLFGTASGATTTAVVTFTTAYTSTPSCVITPTTAGVTSAIITTQANTGFTITYAPSAATTFNYMCGGNPN